MKKNKSLGFKTGRKAASLLKRSTKLVFVPGMAIYCRWLAALTRMSLNAHCDKALLPAVAWTKADIVTYVRNHVGSSIAQFGRKWDNTKGKWLNLSLNVGDSDFEVCAAFQATPIESTKRATEERFPSDPIMHAFLTDEHGLLI